jgi:hypothetical protein
VLSACAKLCAQQDIGLYSDFAAHSQGRCCLKQERHTVLHGTNSVKIDTYFYLPSITFDAYTCATSGM